MPDDEPLCYVGCTCEACWPESQPEDKKNLCKCGAEIQFDGQIHWNEYRGSWFNDVSSACPVHIEEFEEVMGKVWTLFAQMDRTLARAQRNRETYWEIYEKLWELTGQNHSDAESWVQQV